MAIRESVLAVQHGSNLAVGGVILLGLTQLPGDMAFARIIGAGASLTLVGGLAVLVDLVPMVPLGMALAAQAGWRPRFDPAVIFIAVSTLPAVLLTLGAAYGAGGGAVLVLIEGLALTLGLWGMLLRLTGRGVLWAGLMLAGAVLAALWSLAHPVAVARSAQQVAAGAAYCIARHEPDRRVRSWAELRGVSFHTDKSGYKDTSQWFLHGVLLVQGAAGPQAWNWSPRRLRFDRIDRAGDMLQSPFGVCTPKVGFMDRMALW